MFFLRLVSLSLAVCLLVGCASSEPSGNRAAAENNVLLAQKLDSAGNKGAAADYYQKALQDDSKNVNATIGLGGLWEEMGAIEDAEKLYRTAFEADSKQADVGRRLGRVLIALGKYGEARDVYEKILDHHSSDVKALNGLAVALDNMGDHEKAQNYFSKALDEDPQNIVIVNNLAYAAILSGNYDTAIQKLEPLLNDKKATPAMRQNLALAYGLKGMMVDAERVARIDLTEAQVQSNMAYYRRTKAALSAPTEPYIDLGSYPTEAMAQAIVAKVKALDGMGSFAPSITPEVSAPGGTPRFGLRLTGSQSAGERQKACEILASKQISCIVKQE